MNNITLILTKRRLAPWMVLGGLLAAGWAHALQVTPSRQEASLSPGESTGGAFEAYNETSSTVSVSVSVKDWFVLDANKPLAVHDWLSLEKTSFELAPGQKESVPFSIKVPTVTSAGASPQGVFVGMASFSTESEAEPESMVNLVMSMSVYVTIRGTEKQEADIQNFMLKARDGKLDAVADVKNMGNVHLRPSGRVELYDRKNKLIADLPFPEGRPVYPGRSRSLIATFPDLPPRNGAYRAVGLFKLWDKTIRKDILIQWNKKTGVKIK